VPTVRVEYVSPGSFVSPLQGEESLIASCPRVLPWAKLFNAFGVKTEYSHDLSCVVINWRPSRGAGGLLVEMTDGMTKYNTTHYRISVYYDLAKVAVKRLAFSPGHELGPYGATAVAITPGWLRSEMMLDNFGVSESNWRDALDPARAEMGQPVAPPDFALFESPRYVGRAIVALALDPEPQTVESAVAQLW
jgi:NAD(P)-dependent dehydrogenase (short-subunit alcohol dehydrogenase family)